MNSRLRIMLFCLVAAMVGFSAAVADEGKDESGNNCYCKCPGNISADVLLYPCGICVNTCNCTAKVCVKVCIKNKSEIPIFAEQTAEDWTLVFPGGNFVPTTAVINSQSGFDLADPIQPQQTACFKLWVTVDLNPDDGPCRLPNEIKLYKEFCIEDAIPNCNLCRCGFKNTATWKLGNF